MSSQQVCLTMFKCSHVCYAEHELNPEKNCHRNLSSNNSNLFLANIQQNCCSRHIAASLQNKWYKITVVDNYYHINTRNSSGSIE